MPTLSALRTSGVSFQLASLNLRKLEAYATCAVLCLLASATVAAEPQRLTTDGRIKFSPSFINADEIGYVDFEKPTLTVIKRLKLADLSITQLHKGVDKQELEPSFSADGRHCVYIRTFGGVQTGIIIRDEEADANVEIPPENGFCGYRSPSFSPDGKQVVFSFATGGQQDLFLVKREDGKDRQQLTKQSGINNWPVFSPDGKRIAFSSTRDGNFELYSMNVDGTDVVRLTHNRFQDVRPKYSPDGSQIAFTSTRDGNHEVYVMNADGSSLRRVTNNEERDDYPAWHPGGKQLVLVSERLGSHDLYLLKWPLPDE